MPCALIISHPGHELRVHHWLEIARPIVFVLTDGSGSSKHSRLASTTAVLRDTGATTGDIYGAFTDAQFYSLMRKKEMEEFQELARTIALALVREEIQFVVGDALEGYNPSHDVCRFLINCAVESAQEMTGKEVRNYDFPVVSAPDNCPDSIRELRIELTLDDSSWRRKLQAAERYVEIAGDIHSILEQYGTRIFQKEYLRPIQQGSAVMVPEDPPFYEIYGEQRVQQGLYQHVIRYQEHVKPIAVALREPARMEPCES